MMTPALQFSLIWHVLIGILGIIFFVAVLVNLMKDVNLTKLKAFSLSGFISFIIAWFLGGYYYVTFYGKSVKPIIKGGDYPWIHSVIMETKEHVFLFLPFLAAVSALAIWLLGKKIKDDAQLKNALSILNLCIVLLGIAIAVMAISISGAVDRPT